MARLSECGIIEKYEWFAEVKRKSLEIEKGDGDFQRRARVTISIIGPGKRDIREKFESDYVRFKNEINMNTRYGTAIYMTNEDAIGSYAVMLHLKMFTDEEWDRIKKDVVVFDLNSDIETLQEEFFKIATRGRIGRCSISNIKRGIRVYFDVIGRGCTKDDVFAILKNKKLFPKISENDKRLLSDMYSELDRFVESHKVVYDIPILMNTMFWRWDETFEYFITGRPTE